MNLLSDDFPTAVEVAGEVHPVNWRLRDCLPVILAFEDSELTAQEKNAVMLNRLYPEPPEDAASAMEMAVKFLNRGESAGAGGGAGEGRLYSFSHDAPLIFTAIQQRYGVDVERTPDLHWWKFVSMFMDLDPECMFHRVIHLRRGHRRGTLTKDERAAYAAMRRVVELPEALSAEDQAAEDDFMRRLEGR